MRSTVFIPKSLRSAGRELRVALRKPIEKLTHRQFVRAWCSIAYLFPGLHPDDYDAVDSGWSRILKRFAKEAWRRADKRELVDQELYPSDAQWCGIYDRMFPHKVEEIERRLILAAEYD